MFSIALDVNAYMAALPNAFARVTSQASDMARLTAELIAERARHNCPVATGWLQASIGVSKEKKTPTVIYYEVGVVLDVPPPGGTGTHSAKPAEYGLYVEYGTSKQPPHPYLRPALAEVHELVSSDTAALREGRA